VAPEISGESSSVPTLRTMFANERHCCAAYKNLLFSIENSEPTVQYIDATCQTVLELAREQGQQIGMMIVIRADSKPPDEKVRERIKSAVKIFGPHLLGFAHVVEGEGFLTAAKRAAMALLMATARFPFPIKVFRNVHEALPWLMNIAGDARPKGVTAGQLSVLVGELRQRHFEKL
jgi:hypothetical protein